MRRINQGLKAAAITLALAGWPLAAAAQSAVDDEEGVDEVVVTGRFISSAQELVNERMNDA